MTTIAWDGRTLAADRRCCNPDGMIVMVETKLRRCPDGRLLGLAGNLTAAVSFATWLATPEGERGARPDFQSDSQTSVDAIEIEPDGLCWVHQRFGRGRIVGKFAIGSGAPYALAAMAAGKSAAEAVAIAAELDAFTGNGIDELHLAPHEEAAGNQAVYLHHMPADRRLLPRRL